MTLGEKIRLSRKKQGMSQEDLANLLNVSRQSVQKWESDISTPELKKLVEMSNIFNISLDWLVKNEDNSAIKPTAATAKPTLVQSEEKTTPMSKEARLNPKRAKTIKIWLIIGAVLTPLAFFGIVIKSAGYSYQYEKPYWIIILVSYAVTIPLCIAAIKKLNTAKRAEELTGWSAICLIFVSIIGGIIMLATKEQDFNQITQIDNEQIIEEKRKEEALKQEQQAIKEKQNFHVGKLQELYFEFACKRYNPGDINKARKKLTSLENEIRQGGDFQKAITEYSEYLSAFKIDEEYYQKRAKKIKKIIVSIFVAGAVVGAGFAISKGIESFQEERKVINEYTTANTLMENGDYEEALKKYQNLSEYTEGQNKIAVCNGLLFLKRAMNNQNEDVMISGITNIVKGGESVNVTYSLGNDKNTKMLKPANKSENVYKETISRLPVSLYQPELLGYTFERWAITEFYYEDEATNLYLDPVWQPIKYQITYVLNDGVMSYSNPRYYTIEEEVKFNNPTRPGYVFGGWKDQNKQIVSKIDKGTTGEITLTAIWTPWRGTINLRSDDSKLLYTQEVLYDAYYTFPTPSKDGYVFKGWHYEDKEIPSSGCWKSDSITNIYARWEAQSYSITYIDGGKNVAFQPASYTIEDQVVEITDATKNGYTFLGWYYNDEHVSEIDANLLQDITLEAKWSLNTYSISYELNGGTNNASNPATYTIEDSTINLQDPIREGYTFKGWYKTANGNNKVTKINSGSFGDVTLYAIWTANKYTVTLASSKGCTVSFEAYGGTIFDDQHIDQDNGIKYPGIPTKEGYGFKGWYKDEECTELFNFADPILGDTVVYAGYVELNGANYANILEHIDSNSNLSITIVELGAPDIVCCFTAAADGSMTIHANISYIYYSVPQQYFTYSLYTASRSIAAGSFEEKQNTGINVTFEATAGEICWLRISPWSSGVNENTRKVNIYFPNYEMPQEDGNTVIGTSKLTFDQSFALPALTRDGYDFIGWFDDDDTQYTDENGNSIIDWNVAEDIMLYAHWQIAE